MATTGSEQLPGTNIGLSSNFIGEENLRNLMEEAKGKTFMVLKGILFNDVFNENNIRTLIERTEQTVNGKIVSLEDKSVFWITEK